MSATPCLGVGIGLRPQHAAEILAADDPSALGIDFLEAISENQMVAGDAIRARFPVVLHGVSLNIGSADPLDVDYLDDLAALASRHQPAWISDHLCWTGVAGRNLHDLLPLPRTETVIGHLTDRILRVQDRLKERIAFENVSSYFNYPGDELEEWEFMAELARRGDCGILLDVNNVFVNAHNHGFDPEVYLTAMPADRIFQIHLAGHREAGSLLIDTHDRPVRPEVWALYASAVRRLGPVSTLIEWDDEIPALEVLVAEAAKARAIMARVTREQEEQHAVGRSSRPRRDPAANLGAHHGA
jgi:uncharacterized protein